MPLPNVHSYACTTPSRSVEKDALNVTVSPGFGHRGDTVNIATGARFTLLVRGVSATGAVCSTRSPLQAPVAPSRTAPTMRTYRRTDVRIIRMFEQSGISLFM